MDPKEEKIKIEPTFTEKKTGDLSGDPKPDMNRKMKTPKTSDFK